MTDSRDSDSKMRALTLAEDRRVFGVRQQRRLQNAPPLIVSFIAARTVEDRRTRPDCTSYMWASGDSTRETTCR